VSQKKQYGQGSWGAKNEELTVSMKASGSLPETDAKALMHWKRQRQTLLLEATFSA
jgi:hypothetical protein